MARTKTTFLIEDFDSCRLLGRALISLLPLVQDDDSKSSKGKVVLAIYQWQRLGLRVDIIWTVWHNAIEIGNAWVALSL